MIAKMDKLTFLIYHKEYDRFLTELRALGVVHIELKQQGESDENLQALLQQYATYKTVLKEMSALTANAAPGHLEGEATIEATLSDFEAMQGKLQQLMAQLPTLDREIAQMEPWGEFDWQTIDSLKANGWVMQFFCCPEKSFDEAWRDSCHATVISVKGGQAYFVTVNREPVELEAETVRLPHHRLSELKNRRELLTEEIISSKRNLSGYCITHMPIVESAMQVLQGEIDLLKVELGGERMADGALVLLEGWVPEENSETVRQMLEASGVYYEMRPAEKEENAPIKLKNNAVTRLFEVLTKMY